MADVSVIYNDEIIVDPIVTRIEWFGDVALPFRRLELSLKNTVDGVTRAITFEKGRELRLIGEGTELFRGVIFKDSINERGDMTLTAYDENIYLMKNADSLIFRNMTASAIIQQICTAFGVPVGAIDDIGYVIPRILFQNKAMWDMIRGVLTETYKQTGKRYVVYSKEGLLYVSERRGDIVQFVLDGSANVISANYSTSIEDLRNQVKVIADDPERNPIMSVKTDDESIGKYGLMQHVEIADSDKTASQVDGLAKTLLEKLSTIADEASIQALGDVNVIAGAAVYCLVPMAGIMGGYYVVTDSHTWENGVHRMTVTLSADETLPTMTYTDEGIVE